MPIKPGKDEKQADFVSRCIKTEMDAGTAQDNKQAAAMCYSMWRENQKGKSVALSVVLKTDVSAGRVRWKAIANSGEFDQQGDRFDESFFDDLVGNFWAVQDAVSRGLPSPPGYASPEGMPVPQLDVAHYSFELPKADRIRARVGVPTYAYRDGKKFIMQGHFETTPLGQAASKSILADDADIIKTSIGVWPDWNRVELLDDGRRIFKGGAGVAYEDHLALTAHPVDAQTEISAEGQMSKNLTVADDALTVIKDAELVKELEAAAAAKSEAMPAGALVKAEAEIPAPVAESVVTVTTEHSDKTVTTVEKDKAADAIEAAQLSAQLAAQQAMPQTVPPIKPDSPDVNIMTSSAEIQHSRNMIVPGVTDTIHIPELESIQKSQSDMADVLKTLAARVEALEKSIPKFGAINELATALNSAIEATKASEAQKVKAMLDNRGWLDIAKLYSARSAQDNTVDDGKRAKGPQETQPEAIAGGPIAGRFIR